MFSSQFHGFYYTDSALVAGAPSRATGCGGAWRALTTPSTPSGRAWTPANGSWEFDGELATQTGRYGRSRSGGLVCQQRYDAAIPVLRKLLPWNPNDNQGIRYVLGPTLLRAGRRRQSMKALAETAGENPAMRYETRAGAVEDEKYVDAATTLRHAGIENPYIAEHLTGTLFPEPMPLWLGSNLHDYERAYDDEEHWSKAGEENGEATDFLR